MKANVTFLIVILSIVIVAIGNRPQSIIVQGEGAMEAVERVGGTVSADLWLIDGVATALTPRQIAQLDGFAISADIGVKSADWDGYVSNRRRVRASDQFEQEMINPIVPLPDGGAVTVGKGGLLVILNEDGSSRATVDLDTDKVKYAPVVADDGIIYVLNEERVIYAIDSTGSLQWEIDLPEKVRTNLMLRNDSVVAIDEKRKMLMIDRLNGDIISQTALNNGERVETANVSDINSFFLLDKEGQLAAYSWLGELRWEVETDLETNKLYAPILDGETIYIVSSEGDVHGYQSVTGEQRFELELDEIKLRPQFSAGLLLVEDEKRVVRVAPNGDVFLILQMSKKIRQVSIIDQVMLLIDEDDRLTAANRWGGGIHWQLQLPQRAVTPAVLDKDGNIVVATENGLLMQVTADGQVMVRQLDDKVVLAFGRNGNGDLLVPLGDKGKTIATLAQLADNWDGQADVTQLDTGEYDFFSPTPIDVGADQLHDQGVTGSNIGIAVVDSGVYFDDHVQQTLGNQVSQQFVGQADFVGSGNCHTSQNTFQNADHCWSDHRSSIDPYGHGSHVAGIIWNQFEDVDTGVRLGIAPDANILSVRVLDDEGRGSYSDVIEGIQYVVANKDQHNIHVLNLSLSGEVLTPYFADPLNRAVERAWEAGIVVVAAAGNTDGSAESITAPGNDPYIITVGAVDTNRTAAFWSDDTIPAWSASGPTLDGFVKPDVLAPGSNVVSFIYNGPGSAAYLAENHPDYSESSTFFRMNGTSMATAVTSGVVALMLDQNDAWTPDQIKYRLLATAQPATEGDALRYPILQQGAGRIWAIDAAMADLPDEMANAGMDISADLAHTWQNGDSTDPADLSAHYQGAVQREVADDYTVYFVERDGLREILGVIEDGQWLGQAQADEIDASFGDAGTLTGGGWAWSTNTYLQDSTYYWAGTYYWGGGWAWSTGWDLEDSADVTVTNWVP